ncbi:MAG TPA: universal stress protein, partial [Nocardioides sp.]|nr:universal stress protein [Nocardioides sp.]
MSAVNTDADTDTDADIVLAVPPEEPLSEGTIGFAVDTAARLGAGIRLVHVVPTLVGDWTGTWDTGVGFPELLSQGRVHLEEVAAQVRDRAGAVPVSTELLRGEVVRTLVDRSRLAQFVVVEHRDLGRWERWSGGSVTGAVAARAHAPVVSVPADWHPLRIREPITVGVEDAARAEAEVWTALGLAAAEELPVRFLRVAYLAQGYQELLRRQVDQGDLLRAARAQLRADVDLPASVRERVPCRFEVSWGKPAEILVKASAASSLLVVARRDPRLPFGSHLGPVVRQLL